MIAPFARPRALLAQIDLSLEARSRLLLVGLSLLVVLGFAVSLLAPMIFRSAFAGVEVSPGDLTVFMIGW